MNTPSLSALKVGVSVWKKLFPGLDLPYFDGVLPHGPEAVVEAFHNIYLSGGHDAVIAVGGGSVLGLGKIMSVGGAGSVCCSSNYIVRF